MPPLSHILADNDENFGKLILFAIIIVIWAVRAIANVAKSSGQKKPSPPPMPAARPVAPRVPSPIQPRPKPLVAARAKPVGGASGRQAIQSGCAGGGSTVAASPVAGSPDCARPAGSARREACCGRGAGPGAHQATHSGNCAAEGGHRAMG